MRRLVAAVLIASICLQAVAASLAAASAQHISSLYNNYIGPATQANAEQVGPYNAFFANNKELIHPGNGNLTLSHTDLVLPGRNGLDLIMTRMYNNQQSNAYQKTSHVASHTWSEWVPPVTEQRQVLVQEGYSYSTWVERQVGGGYWSTVCRDEWVEGYWAWGFYIDEWDYLVPYQYWVPGYFRRVCETAWVDPIYERQEVLVYVAPVYATVTIELIPGHYRYYTDYWVETSRSLETHLDRRHGLGLGWQWDFPSLELRDGHIIYHSGQQSLAVDWNVASRFKDYPLLDIRFETDAQTFSNGQLTSHYRVVAKEGSTTYFASDGRLLGIKDRYGNTITFKHTLWNGQHLIGEIVDSLGRVTRLTYRQSAVELTAPDGRVWRYNLASTSVGKPVLSSAVDPLGRTTSYTYQLDTGYFSFTNKHSLTVANVFANLQSVTYPTGGSSGYTYIKVKDNLGNDGARELYKVSSRQDNVDSSVVNLVTYTYSGEPGGFPTHASPFNLPSSFTYSGTMTKADGTKIKTTYNHLHLQTRLETEGPGIKQVAVTSYDSRKTPTQVTTTVFNTSGGSATTHTFTTFDQHNNLISSTDALGTVTNYTYDAARFHQLTSVQATRSDGVVLRTEYTVATNGDRTRERRVYVENGVNREINTHFTYDQYGNLTQCRLVMEDGTERITQYEYSPTYHQAYLTKVTVPYASGSQVTTIEYNLNTGYKTATVDPLSNRTTYQHDNLGRLTRHTNPDNTFRTYAYDDLNRSVTVTLENGAKSMFVYDRLGRLSEERVWLNNAWQVTARLTYDALSRKSSVENGVGLATTYHYDGGDRVTKTIFPGNLEEVTAYNDATRTVSVRDSNGNTTLRTFDVLGRLIQVQQKPDPQGATTYTSNYTYDNVGNLLTVTDAKGNITSRQYDGLNRLKRFIYPAITPARSDVVFTYNNAGQKLTETTDITTQYAYDRRGLLTRITYSDATYAEYTYDVAGRRTGDLASAGNILSVYTYDNRNRLTNLTRTIDGTAYALGLGYDAVGNVTSILYPGDTTPLTQVYDELNRLKAVNGFAGTTNTQGLWYDLAGRLTRMQYSNGITIDYHYNNRALLSRIQSPIVDLNFVYDSNGNITGINNETYTYDGLNRLLTASQPSHNYTVAYQYDAVGNRISQVENGISTTYGYNAVNELTSSTGTTYTYDRRGNLVQKVVGADTWIYTYDPANRLREVKKNSTILGTYFYDANGIRAKKVEGGQTTHYLALGHKNLYEQTGTVGTKHIFAGSQRIAEVKNGVVSYYHNDHLGSPRAVTNASGTLIASTSIRPFGQPHSSNNPTDYLFASKELDSTGLYYFAARYYDPSVGRFITEDPYWNASSLGRGNDREQSESIAAMMQATNLYVYCGNNPLILVDPSGEIFMVATGLVGAVAGGIAGAIYSLRANDGRGVSWRHVATGAAIGGAIGLTGGAAACIVVTAGKTPLATVGTIVSGAAVASHPLQQASNAADAAADRITDYTVKAKHLMSTGGTYSKFVTDSQKQARIWMQRGLQSKRNQGKS